MIFEAKERAKEMIKLNEKVRAHTEKVNEKCKAKANKNCTHLEFQSGDLVWILLRKERFPSRRKSKFMARGDCPYEIVQKVGDNAYKIKLQGDMNISATFNVKDLTPYIEDEDESHEYLRVNALQVGGCYIASQIMQPLNHNKVLVQIGPMVKVEQGLQRLGLTKSLLTWDP